MKHALIIATLAVAVAGCATMTRGTTQAWTVTTSPSGAAVKTTNGFSCEATPCTFTMPRKSDFMVTISKPGFKTWEGKVTNQVSGGGGAAMAGNVLVGGLIGAGVDASSGAMLDITPNPLEVTLEPEAAPAQAPTAPAAPTTPPTS